MGVVERAAKAQYMDKGGSGNRDPETWSGTEPHALPIGHKYTKD